MRRRVYQVASVVVFCSIIVGVFDRAGGSSLSYVRSRPFTRPSISLGYAMGDDQPELQPGCRAGQIGSGGRNRGTGRLAIRLTTYQRGAALNKMGVHAGDSAPASPRPPGSPSPCMRAPPSWHARHSHAPSDLMEAMTQPRASRPSSLDWRAGHPRRRRRAAGTPAARMTDAFRGDKRIRANAAAALGRIGPIPRCRSCSCVFDADELVRTARDAMRCWKRARGRPSRPANQ